MLTPEAEASIKAHQERKTAFIRGEGPITRLGPRTIGDMALLDVGCVCWAKSTEIEELADLTYVRMNYNGEARGGVIVEVTDATTFTEDGEIVKQRAFKCLDPYLNPTDHRAWTLLTEEQVDLQACEAPKMTQIRGLYRKIAGEVARCRGVARGEEIDMAVVLGRLASVVGHLT